MMNQQRLLQLHNFPHPVKRIGQVRSQEKRDTEKPINNQFDMLV